MAEQYNPVSLPAELIDTMVNSVADVFYGTSRDIFVEWAMEYLDSNGTTAPDNVFT